MNFIPKIVNFKEHIIRFKMSEFKEYIEVYISDGNNFIKYRSQNIRGYVVATGSSKISFKFAKDMNDNADKTNEIMKNRFIDEMITQATKHFKDWTDNNA